MEDFFRIGYSQTSHDIFRLPLSLIRLLKGNNKPNGKMSLTHIGKLKATSRKRQRQ